MATTKLFQRLFFFVAIFVFLEGKLAFAADCKTSLTTIQPKQDVGVDNKQYIMINILGFEQNATSIECLPNQSCKKGKCQQDYKLHQFLTLPHGKQTFELSELKFRFFKIPYGCKCAA